MSFFRCYALNQEGRIQAAKEIEVPSIEAAVHEGWQFVAAEADEEATGLEIWQGCTMIYSTFPAVSVATSF